MTSLFSPGYRTVVLVVYNDKERDNKDLEIGSWVLFCWIEMEETMQRERDESQRIIRELREKLEAQESRRAVDDRPTDHLQNSITLGLQDEKKVDA